MTKRIMDISPNERVLLGAMRKRAPMFVGEYSLAKIGVFLSGYKGALKAYSLDEKYCIIPQEFNQFVCSKYDYCSNMGCIWPILQHMPDGKEAIEFFFELLDGFLEENGFGKIK